MWLVVALCISLNETFHVLPGGFLESETNQITFPGISGAVLERLCQYCYYKLKYMHTYVPICEKVRFPCMNWCQVH